MMKIKSPNTPSIDSGGLLKKGRRGDVRSTETALGIAALKKKKGWGVHPSVDSFIYEEALPKILTGRDAKDALLLNRPVGRPAKEKRDQLIVKLMNKHKAATERNGKTWKLSQGEQYVLKHWPKDRWEELPKSKGSIARIYRKAAKNI